MPKTIIVSIVYFDLNITPVIELVVKPFSNKIDFTSNTILLTTARKCCKAYAADIIIITIIITSSLLT